MSSARDRLFEPLRLGTLTAPNRIVRAATTTNLSEANGVSDRLIAHYSRIAAGGTGTIVTEALRIRPSMLHGPFGIAAFRDAQIPGLGRLADAVHAHGSLLIGQLNHSGRQHTSTSVPPRLVGPSPVACPRSGGVPHELDADEIEELGEGFVRSAVNLHRAGFDGVELNGAQGHLLQQFLSPFSNVRDDRYGGDPARRASLARGLLTRIREETADDFVVGYRLGVEEFTPGGLTVELSSVFASGLERDELVDYVSFSQGNFNSIAAHLPDRHYPHTPFADVQRMVGEALTRVARIACTGIVAPTDAESILAQGWADAVALGRALTVDPEWTAKAQRGEDERIRPCIQCNHCWSGLHEGLVPLTCVQNAEVGRELELGPIPIALTRRRVAVVGGGPAGMEAARVAASGGHEVTLFEATDVLGGKAAAGRGDIGGVTGFSAAAEWLESEVRRLPVDVRLGEPADAASVSAGSPDVVIVATGARPVIPDVVTDGSVLLAAEVAGLQADLAGAGVLVFDEDGHYWAAQVAEEVARRGGRVVLITRFFEPFRELPSVSRIASLRRLDEAGAEILPMRELVRFDRGTAIIRHYDSGRETVLEGISAAVWVGPQLPASDIQHELDDVAPGVAVKVLGDARSPRRLRHAIREAYDVARAL